MIPRSYAAFVVASALTAVAPQANAEPAAVAPGMLFVIAQQSYLDVVGGLETSGYRVLSMKSTLLGRLKIRAQNREHLREVIVSRSTGEIKSDQIIKVFNTVGGDADQAVTQSAATNSKTKSRGASVSVGGADISAGSGGVSASVGGIGVSVGN